MHSSAGHPLGLRLILDDQQCQVSSLSVFPVALTYSRSALGPGTVESKEIYELKGIKSVSTLACHILPDKKYYLRN